MPAPVQILKRLNEIRERMGAAIPRMDAGLVMALILAFAFTLQGINWGRVEDWNPDEMALRSLKKSLEPGNFEKPPFEIYVNRVVVLSWVTMFEQIAQKHQKKQLEHMAPKDAAQAVKITFNTAALLGSRFLTLALFLGSVSLEFAIARRFFGLVAARVTALLMATSAGFIAANHFLTADSPMIFWMLLAFFFCQRILQSEALANYLLAGLLVGLATATKYNALAVGLGIPVAHLLKSTTIKEALLDRRTVLGVLAVPAGFVLGCPYAVLDHRKFVADFMYNYTVTPYYGGRMTGTGYLNFLGRIPQIIGWPGSAWVALAVLGGLILMLLRKPAAGSVKGFLLAASVVGLYYLKIGAFPRMETRFVLPIVPLLLLTMGPFLEFCPRAPMVILLAPVIVYNCVCSFFVGIRFEDDPRMAAQTWVQTHLAMGTSIEETQHCPKWNKLPGVKLDVRNAPNSNQRGMLFSKLFAGNKWVMSGVAAKEGQVNEADFTLEALQKRNPEYIAMDTNAYRGIEEGPVKAYFSSLLEGRYPYAIVFDLQTPPVPDWIYPKDIDVIENRITILRRVGTR